MESVPPIGVQLNEYGNVPPVTLNMAVSIEAP